jgi:hypothetical protein
MSNSNVERLLNRIDTAMGKQKAKNRVDYAELKKQRELYTMKFSPGKNKVALIVPQGASDPFTFWGYHNGLQETPWYSVPCNKYNNDEECLICSVVDDLKKSDWKGNRHIWFPIEQKTEVWAAAVNIENDRTIAQGARWVKFSKTAFSQITEWIRNLEEDDLPFFSHESPYMVSVSYYKDAAPAEQYKLDKKPIKKFSDDQLAEWTGSLKPFAELMAPKSEGEIKKILDEYFMRIQNEVVVNEDAEETTEETTTNDVAEEEVVVTPKKLDSLRRNKQ